ncbi:MAG: sodium:solute symporter family protein [Candidatus Hydrogenedentes bacterium]|nr:sodium:solute symporter family protein [Candidatus Hydrogenedentota bacterium]
MLGISGWDWAALAVYFVVTVVIGLWTVRKVKDTTDFFMAGRRFGKPFMIFFAFGAGTSGNDAVGVSAKTYTNGLSGIWYQWLWLFCTPFYWLIAPVMRRMRALTTGDYFEHRYDGSVAALYSVVGIAQLTVNIGIIQLGAGSMIEGITGGAIDRNVAIVGMTVMFLAYGIAGGLAAAIVTDFIQGILTIILSFILLPFALDAVGGFTGLHTEIQDDSMFSLVAPGEINGFWIFMLGLNALIGIVTQPHIMGVCAAGRTEMDGRVGFACGNLIKRLCTVAWTVVGLCAVVMYMNQDIDPDVIYGQAAKDLLPSVMPGLVGVFIAALIASVMSSCDAFMVSCSGLFTQNIYRRWIRRDESEGHYVGVGRITALVVVAGGLSFAFLVGSVPEGLMLFFKMQALMGAAFWLGLFWRRTTVAGAWAATLSAFAILLFTSLDAFQEWAVANLPEIMIWNGEFRDSWQIFFYLIGGFGMGIAVSLVSKRVPEEKLERVYRCLRTPVHEAEPHQPEPFMLPEGLEVPAPRKLINHPDLEIPMPTRVGMYGFATFWAIVGILIAFVYWMATWGA